MTRGIALSTMYFQRPPPSGDPLDLPGFTRHAVEMGFAGVELGHQVAGEALSRLDPGSVPVVAVHHPCPATAGGPGAESLTAEDPAARAAAVDSLRRSIETAARYGAPVVVAHLGRLDGDPGAGVRRLAFEMTSRYLAGQSQTARYARVMEAIRADLDAAEPAHLARAEDGLRAALPYAARNGVAIALETGYHADELPRPMGMRQLLDRLGPSGLGAWLDIGHVGAQANLGLTRFDEWFEAAGGAWLGAHLHDLVGLRDHLVPGMGALDLPPLLGALPGNAVLTCEIDWYFEPAEVRVGLALVERLCAGRKAETHL